jgi:hypothetical protein
VAADVALFGLCLYGAGRVLGLHDREEVLLGLPELAAFVGIGVLTFILADLYESEPRPGGSLALRVVLAVAAWGLLYLAAVHLLPGLNSPSAPLCCLGLGLAAGAAIGLRAIASRVQGFQSLRERLLFLGATPLAERLIA